MSLPKLPKASPIAGFDAVGFMRQQRDRISREIAGMTVEEEAAYFAEGVAWLDEIRQRKTPEKKARGARPAKVNKTRRQRVSKRHTAAV